MSASPRQVLCTLINQRGAGLGDDVRLLEALLRDFCGEYKREIAVLLSAQRAAIPAGLQSSRGVPAALLLTRLAQLLRSQQGLEELAARWAVESWALALGSVTPADLTSPEALGLPQAGPPAPRAKPSPVVARQYEVWKRDLFDFSRRNPLLYYKPTQSSALEILTPAPDELFDLVVAKGKTLNFPYYRVEVARPEPGARYRYTYTLVRKGQLECDKQEGALIRALGNIRTLARASRTELGLNSLYLGFGLLRWCETGSTVQNAAPLLMVPADIEVKEGRDRFVLKFFDDDIVLNPTLAAFLSDPRLGYHLDLPEYPEEQGVTVSAYLDGVSARVAPRGWQVEARVVLRLFSFQTIRMGKDMDQAGALNLYPPLIRLLARDPNAPAPPPLPGLPSDLDQQLRPEEFLQVLEADASQVEALAAARSGAPLVLHGPPGTGKSQTIVNLIAQAVADHKTVLFVSQKKAALDVVYHRLAQLGLDKFCLQAHSDKANKRAILSELQAVYHNPKKNLAPPPPHEYLTLYEQRTRLDGVARELNTPLGELGWTIQSVQGRLITAAEVPNLRSPLSLPAAAPDVSALQWQAIQAAAQAAVAATLGLGCPPEQHPWHGLVYSPTALPAAEMQLRLTAFLQTLEQIARFARETPPRLALPPCDSYARFGWFLSLAGILQDAPPLPAGWLPPSYPPYQGGAGGDSASSYPATTGGNSAAASPAKAEGDFITLAKARESHLRGLFSEARRLAEAVLAGRETLRRQGVKPELERIDAAEALAALRRERAALDAALPRPYLLAARTELGHSLGEAQTALEGAQRLLEHIAAKFGFAFPLSLGRLDWLAGLGRLCAADPRPQPGWFTPGEMARLRAWLQNDVTRAANAYTQARARVQTNWNDEVLNLNVDGLAEFLEVRHKNALERMVSGEYRNWSSGVARSWRGARKPAYEDFLALLQELKTLRASLGWLNANDAALRKHFGTRYQGAYTNFAAIAKAIEQTTAILDYYRGQPVPPAFQKSLCEGTFQAGEWTQFATQCEQSAAQVRRALSGLLPRLKPSAVTQKAGEGDHLLVKPALEAVRELNGTLGRLNQRWDGLVGYFQTPPGLDGLFEALQTCAGVSTALASFNAQSPAFQTAFESYFTGLQTDWDALDRALQVAARLAVAVWAGGLGQEQRTAGLAQYTAPNRPALQAGPIVQSGTPLATRYTQQLNELVTGFTGPDGIISGCPELEASFAQVRAWAEQLLSEIERYPAWQEWVDAEHELGVQGLEAIWNEVRQAQPAALEQFPQIVEKRFAQAWLTAAYPRLPLAGNLKVAQHRQQIHAFEKLDQKLIHAQRDKVLLAWQANLPAVTHSVPDSQVGILAREFQKKRAHLPLRHLFAKIPDLLLKLKPCVLMSPLSVAAYLDLEHFQEGFDLVIFDEASQVKPAYAIGAILRGKQVIVAGDTRQLPPTDFFQVTGELEEYLEDEGLADDDPALAEPLESILGELIGLPGVRQSTLLWHYRSRHEALIQFSNRAYYHDELITFPDPNVDATRTAIQFVAVDGIYDRGKTRQNAAEAQRIVTWIAEEWAPRAGQQSLGVITLSTAQEEAIREALRHAIDRPGSDLAALAEFLNEDAAGDEPFFIKSLERVQGDERDMILLSVGYGPDANGKLTQNFGPINMDGGERRLNVAITRARQALVVFASLSPAEIRLNDRSKPGLCDLKRFLEYCQGLDEIQRTPASASRQPPFEAAVQNAVRELGYIVDSQVGLGHYQIDLAVRHPERPDEYVLAIETDGPGYAAAPIARDREWLRPRVVTGMGWRRVLRLWSREWFEQPKPALQALKLAIQEASRDTPAPPTTPPPEAPPAQDPAPAEEPPLETPVPPTPVEWEGQLNLLPYVAYRPSRQYSLVSGRLRIDLIKEIVQVEQPIHRDLLLERWASCFAADVSDYRKKQAFAQYLERSLTAGRVVVQDDFVRLAGFNGTVVPRAPAAGEAPRKIEQIPLEEISALAAQVLANVYGIRRAALARKTAELLGYKTTTPARQERIDAAIQKLIEQGAATVNGEAVLPNTSRV